MGGVCARRSAMTAARLAPAGPSRHESLRLARRFRQALGQAEAAGGAALTVKDLLLLHGHASIATLLMLYALFCLMPVGGVGNVFGVALWWLSWQWARGQQQLVLPERVAGIRLNARLSAMVLRALASGYRVAARWLRPRWFGLQAPWTQAWWASWIAVQAAVIFLPVPLGNALPAFSLVALGLGRLLADGLMHAASLVLGVLGLVYLGALGQMTWQLVVGAARWVGAWLG